MDRWHFGEKSGETWGMKREKEREHHLESDKGTTVTYIFQSTVPDVQNIAFLSLSAEGYLWDLVFATTISKVKNTHVKPWDNELNGFLTYVIMCWTHDKINEKALHINMCVY